MSLEEAFTFSLDELPYTSFAAFEDMRERGELCDLTITAQNHSFTAHRVILAGGIPYFRSLFTTNAADTSKKEIILGDLDATALESLIRFAYTGVIDISVDNVRHILLASQFLELDKVCNACVDFLSKRFRVDDVVQVRAFAYDINSSNLIENSNCFIKKNFAEFSKSDDFLSLSCSSVKEIISEDDLNVSGEEVVFEAVMKWIKAEPSERHDMLPELLSEVRMIYLSTEYLIEQVISDELVTASKPCRDLIDEVKNYYFSPKDKALSFSLKTVARKKDDSVGKDAVIYAICQEGSYGTVSYFDSDANGWYEWASHKQNDKLSFAAATNDKIYMFLERTIQVLHVKTKKFEVLQSSAKHNPRTAAVVHKNTIYCFESLSSGGLLRCFDTQQNKFEQEGRTFNRKYPAPCSLGDFIYVTGGEQVKVRYTGVWAKTNSVQRHTPSTGQWTDISPMLDARARHGCTSTFSKIYVCGGYESVDNSKVIISSAEMYDPCTEQWNFISSMNWGRYFVSLVPYCKKIWALGGHGVYDETVNDTEIYSEDETKVWSVGNRIPRGFQIALVVAPADK